METEYSSDERRGYLVDKDIASLKTLHDLVSPGFYKLTLVHPFFEFLRKRLGKIDTLLPVHIATGLFQRGAVFFKRRGLDQFAIIVDDIGHERHVLLDLARCYF